MRAFVIPRTILLASISMYWGCERSSDFEASRDGVSGGGHFHENGVGAKYSATRGDLDYLVVFDRAISNPASGGPSSDGSGFAFTLKGGESFSLQVPDPESVTIENTRYDLDDGRLFLFRFTGGSPEVAQRNTPLDRVFPAPGHTVENEVERLMKEDSEMGAWFASGAKNP